MVFIKNAAKAMVKAIGKVWSFATIMALIATLAAFVIFIITIAMPENVSRALEIVKSFLTEVGIVGSG